MTSRDRGRRVAAAALAMVSVLTATVACGRPEFTFVSNSDEKTYFKVPYDWAKIDERPIDNLVSGNQPGSFESLVHKSRVWSVAYDADQAPSADHMTNFLTDTDAPVVYVAVQHLIKAEQDAMSLDRMRNYFLPVTEPVRKLAEENDFPLTGFEELGNDRLAPTASLHGVRVIYNYNLPSGVRHTFDQSVYVNNDASTLYFLLIRCTFRCYIERKAEIDTVVTSFTVRSQ